MNEAQVLKEFEKAGALLNGHFILSSGLHSARYLQCARALMRSRIWTSGNEADGLPSMGEILAEQTAGEEGGRAYDEEWAPRAAKTMW